MGIPIKLHKHEFEGGRCRCGLQGESKLAGNQYSMMPTVDVSSLNAVLGAPESLEHPPIRSLFCWLTPQRWPKSQPMCTNCNLPGASGMFVMYDAVEDSVVRGCDNCGRLRREELEAVELAPELWMVWHRAYWTRA